MRVGVLGYCILSYLKTYCRFIRRFTQFLKTIKNSKSLILSEF